MIDIEGLRAGLDTEPHQTTRSNRTDSIVMLQTPSWKCDDCAVMRVAGVSGDNITQSHNDGHVKWAGWIAKQREAASNAVPGTHGAAILTPATEAGIQKQQVQRELMLLRARKEAKQQFLAEEAAQDVTRNTWEAMDLEAYLDGSVVPLEPSVGLVRSDGVRLIYPGKEHSIVGEMESGKSWISVACCAAEIEAGNHVVYVHFEEADPSGTLDRLRSLGVDKGKILKLFRFVGPAQPVGPDDLAHLLDPAPSLVILDGVNEAMSLHGSDTRHEDGVANFRRYLIKPIKAAGAAVVMNDHVVKDKTARGRDAIGSIHKGNALDGALIMVENMEPFGRGQRGVSAVFVTKDRPGFLRKHGRPDKKLPGKTLMGVLVVDDTREYFSYLDLKLFAPKPEEALEATEAAGESLDELVLGVVVQLSLEQVAEPTRLVNQSAIVARAARKKVEVVNSLERLYDQRRISVQSGPRGMKIYAPVTCSQDQEVVQ